MLLLTYILNVQKPIFTSKSMKLIGRCTIVTLTLLSSFLLKHCQQKKQRSVIVRMGCDIIAQNTRKSETGKKCSDREKKEKWRNKIYKHISYFSNKSASLKNIRVISPRSVNVSWNGREDKEDMKMGIEKASLRVFD